MQALTLYVKTPDDERQVVGRVVERLQARYWKSLRLEIAGPARKAAECDVIVWVTGSTLEPEMEAVSKEISGGEVKPEMLIFRDGLGQLAQQLEERLEKFLKRGAAMKTGLVEGSPFRAGGFAFQDAGLFFGRNREIEEALEQLKRNRLAGHAFLPVHGEAGCGKTSLMLAGLAPRLTAEGCVPETGAWRRAMLLAEKAEGPAVAALAGVLVEALPELGTMKEPWDGVRLGAMLKESLPLALATLMAALDRVSAAKPAQLLVMVDGMERFQGAKDQEAFFRILAAMARCGRIWVVGTMRSGALPEEDGYLLATPEAAGLREIIRCPALAAGLEFERRPGDGKELSERILEDAETELPGLLEFALEELYQKRRGRLLTWAAYGEMGDLRGAAARVAGEGDAAPVQSSGQGKRKLRLFQGATVVFAAVAAGALFLRQPPQVELPHAGIVETAPRPSLAQGDFEAGALRVESGSPDEAIPYLLSALENDPHHLEAQALLLATLRETRWHFPVMAMKHPLPVHGVAFGPDDDTLFSAMDGHAGGGGFTTALRWNLKNGFIESLLKPARDQAMQVFSLSPDGGHALVERGSGESAEMLLCDATTMQIVRRLGASAGSRFAGACFAWSPDGLLLGYPSQDDKNNLVWKICDVASGDIVRESEPLAAGPEWLAASLGRTALRMMAADGTVLELPLNPTTATRTGKLGEAVEVAVFSPDGSEILACTEATRTLAKVEDSTVGGMLEIGPLPAGEEAGWMVDATLMDRFPWTRENSRFHELLLGLQVGDTRLDLGAAKAPVRENSRIESMASRGDRLAIGNAAGELTVHRWLPAMTELPAAKEGAVTMAVKLERARQQWQLHRDGKTVPLTLASGWESITAVAVNRAGDKVVVAGQGKTAGMMLVDAGTGAALSEIEPVEGIRGLEFIGDRIAAAGSTGVLVADIEKDGFRKARGIPIAGAAGVKYLESRRALAVATAAGVALFDAEDFSKLETLGIPGAMDEKGAVAWAEDPGHGWLAYAQGSMLHVWSLRSGRLLAPRVALPAAPQNLGFTAQDGMWGVRCDAAFVPLVREEGIDLKELETLRAFSGVVAGSRFAVNSQSVVFSKATERRAAVEKIDLKVLSKFLPASEADEVVETVRELAPVESTATAWIPVWESLALSGQESDAQVARWAADLGTADPWFQSYIRGLIGDSDGRFYERLRGEKSAAVPPPALPQDNDAATFRRLAGESPEVREIHRAARVALTSEPAERDQAVALLEAYAAKTKADYDADASAGNAILHAEGLALAGKLEEAEKFLDGKIGGEVDLTLEQAHFLVDSGLARTCGPAVEKSLKVLHSQWLWKAWLDFEARDDRQNLAARVQEAMAGNGPSGPVAARALRVALRERKPEAIAIVLKQAKDLPPALREYALARGLWIQGKKAEVFALWPQQFPDLKKLAETSDWDDWDQAVTWEETSGFFGELNDELATLKAEPDAPVSEQKAVAKTLLAPETATTFGGKRVRDAMVDLALTLAYDPGSYGLVLQMIERARLSGADPTLCVRAEARALLTRGESTAAYARWLEILEAPETGLISKDYLEAAQCLVIDQQEVPAVELLTRGKDTFPTDAGYAYQAAWTLLSEGHPDEAGILLEHGFQIPFAADQVPLATAMLVCAAEQRQKTDKADQAYRDLVKLDPKWGVDSNVKLLDWPEALKQALLGVAARNR